MLRRRITSDRAINDWRPAEQLGSPFRQEGQCASAHCDHQVWRTFPIFLPEKIPLPLPLLLARKSGYVEELAVKFDVIAGVGCESRVDGLIHDDISRQ